MTEQEIVRWARYYAVLAERFPPDTYREQGVQPEGVAVRPGRVYGRTRQGSRKGAHVN